MILKICQWLFLLLVVSLPLVRPFNVSIFNLLAPYTDFIFVGVFLCWLLALLRKEAKFHFHKFYIFIALYALALTVSTVFSTAPQKSFYKLLGEFYLFALAVVSLNLARDNTFIKKIVIAWLIGTSLTIAASLAGFALFYLGFKTQTDNYFLSHFGSLPAGNYPRIHALFANANMMCNFLNVSLMMALLAEKAGWMNKAAARILQTGIWFAAVFTFSPGLGGMIVSTGIWFWAVFRQQQKSLFAKLSLNASIFLAALVFAATLVSPDTANTPKDISVPFSTRKIEPSVRVLVWENALAGASENLLTGKGTGTNAAMVQYRTVSGDNQILLDAHNAWLNVLAQTGLPGLAAFLLLVIFLIKKSRFDFDRLDERALVHLALSCAFAGAFLYQGLSGSFEDARHLWILFALLAGASMMAKNDISEASPAP